MEDLDGDVEGNPPLEATSNSNGSGAEDFSITEMAKRLNRMQFLKVNKDFLSIIAIKLNFQVKIVIL